MRPAYGLDPYEFNTTAYMNHIQVKDKIIGKDWLICFATEILDEKYEWTNVRNVVQQIDHLYQTHKYEILKVLKKKLYHV